MTLEQIIVDRLEKIDARVRSLELQMTSRLTSVEAKIDRLDNHELELKSLEGRLELLEEARAERRGAMKEATKAKHGAWGAIVASMTAVIYQIIDWAVTR